MDIPVSTITEVLEINKTTLFRWEHESARPNILQAVRLAQILGVDLDTIFSI